MGDKKLAKFFPYLAGRWSSREWSSASSVQAYDQAHVWKSTHDWLKIVQWVTVSSLRFHNIIRRGMTYDKHMFENQLVIGWRLYSEWQWVTVSCLRFHNIIRRGMTYDQAHVWKSIHDWLKIVVSDSEWQWVVYDFTIINIRGTT